MSFFTYVGLGLGFLGSSLALPFGLYVLICQRTSEKYVQVLAVLMLIVDLQLSFVNLGFPAAAYYICLQVVQATMIAQESVRNRVVSNNFACKLCAGQDHSSYRRKADSACYTCLDFHSHLAANATQRHRTSCSVQWDILVI